MKVVLDIRAIDTTAEDRQTLVTLVTSSRTITAANVGFLTAPGGVFQFS
jgi:hypothetical protein